MAEDAPRVPLVQGLGIAFILASFAFNSLATRAIVSGGHLEGALTAMVRFVAGAATLAVLALLLGRASAARPSWRFGWSAFWLGAYAFLISYGYRFIGAAAGTLVFFAAVLVTMAGLDAWRLRRAPPARALVGALLALGGLAVLAAGDVATVTALGLILMVGTGAAWGAYSMLARGGSGDPIARTAGPFVVLGVVLAPPLVILVGSDAVAPITTQGLLWATFMGIVPTAIAYTLWSWTLPRLAGTQAGVYQMMVPVLTGIGAVVVLGEAADASLVVAGLLVVTGMALTTPRRRARPVGSGDPEAQG